MQSLLKNRALWEHPVLDLWSVPHLLSGTIVAYAVLWLGVDPWLGLGISVALAVVWEIFEKVTHLSDVEHHTNGWSDVIAAQIGYGAGWWLFAALPAHAAWIAGAAVLVFAALSILGWLSHHWYGKK